MRVDELRATNRVDHDHVDRKLGALARVEIAGHNEVIHHVVLVIEIPVERRVRSAAVGVGGAGLAPGFGAQDQHSLAGSRLHCGQGF